MQVLSEKILPPDRPTVLYITRFNYQAFTRNNNGLEKLTAVDADVDG